MWKHCSSMHLGVEQTFTIKLLKKHKSAFERQVHESVLITFGKVDFILDSKREWSGESLPRLTLEVHDGTKLEPVIVGHKRTNNQATATNQVTTSCAKRSRVGEPGDMGEGCHLNLKWNQYLKQYLNKVAMVGQVRLKA